MQLGEKIRKVMSIMKCNQTQFAANSGIDRTALNKMINENIRAREVVYIALEYYTGIDRNWFKTADDAEPVYIDRTVAVPAMPSKIAEDVTQFCELDSTKKLLAAIGLSIYNAATQSQSSHHAKSAGVCCRI